MPGPEEARLLPRFISSNQAASPFFYFHHLVDGEDGTLTVQVIGPSLEFRFRHPRARAFHTQSSLARRLLNKTTGFLALVSPSTGERTVLAAAESGHGSGRFGDVLDAPPGVLANSLWTRRVVAVGRLLGLSMAGPFDRGCGGGCFQGSHVEVKLAVHAVAVLLDVFKITRDFDNDLEARHLRSLRGVRWDDGSRPCFEVFFSRRNCGACGKLVRCLEEATGVTIRLLWKPRLELRQYPKRTVTAAARRRLQQRGLDDAEEQDVDLGDELSEEDSDDETVGGEEDRQDEDGRLDDDDDDDDDDVRVIDMVDLRSHPPFSLSPEPHPADAYIDGLAYRVGQMESSPDGAAEAIVQFAQQMTGNQVRWALSPPPAPPRASRCISKPLPATPETRPPAWMMADRRGNTSPPSTTTTSGGYRLPVRNRSSSPCERAAMRDRSPRRYSTGLLERIVVGERRSQSRVSVQIPARRRSAN
ncbi:hypothetical protein AK830_g10877 [Neonectria ditissima]|uniref:Uncharacterized protein n=1 Tax=Neonectria ditissima TaxID=78410 RepID=A0A0P7ASD6_9HYPO|nr:hypothetical protein AK830_g10877 [Neonectria ditissima]